MKQVEANPLNWMFNLLNYESETRKEISYRLANFIENLFKKVTYSDKRRTFIVGENSYGKRAFHTLSTQKIQTLAARAEREVPEYGDFRTVEETVNTISDEFKHAISEIKLVVLPPLDVKEDPTERMLALEVKIPDGTPGGKGSSLLEVGNKKQILEVLLNPELQGRIERIIAKMANQIVEGGFV